MNKAIRHKSQIIDDDSEFRIQELQTLAKQTNRIDNKQYQIVSIIGSQSSGKSTLLNALFQTDFDVLNRKQRVGQTTKGIWFSVQTPSNIIVLDVEGSDSNQRQERTKVQRKNSLFAFAISHTLLINIWIQQIGTFKGAQLEILEIILQLNLKLFGSEKPKQIVFVVRDFVEKKENPQALKQKLISKVQDAWNKIPKPANKSHIKLSDVFQLTVFFLPSKLQERQKENWNQKIKALKSFLVASTKNKELIKDNIPVNDMAKYMQNIWQTIQADKDINLPQQKVLLSSMRCQEIKKKIYDTYADQFRDQIQKSQRSLNNQFAKNIGIIVNKIFTNFQSQTSGYIEEEVMKVRIQFEKQLSDKIEESFQKQSNMFADDCLRQFLDLASKSFSKDKNLQDIRELKPKTLQIFTDNITKLAYKPQWKQPRIQKFAVQLQKKFQNQKQKIVNDSVKQYDRILRREMQNAVSNAFYDRKIFTELFWQTLTQQLKNIGYKSRNSIQNLYNKLQIGGKKQIRQTKIRQLCQKAQEYAEKQLRNFIKMKCIDLRYFLMKHFSNQFNNQNDIPRQWPTLKEEQIRRIHEELKRKYYKLIDNFEKFDLSSKQKVSGSSIKTRNSYIDPKQFDESDEILGMKEEVQLRKKLQEQINKQLEQALRKNKQTYSASIPTWAYVLLGIAALDDILLWISSPMIALPFTIILILIVLSYMFGGKTLIDTIVSKAKQISRNAVTSATKTAATSLLKKD